MFINLRIKLYLKNSSELICVWKDSYDSYVSYEFIVYKTKRSGDTLTWIHWKDRICMKPFLLYMYIRVLMKIKKMYRI